MTRLVVIVPCSGAKAPVEQYGTLAAGELYVGAFYRYARQAAARLGADVVIASALHGLIGLDAQVATYDARIDDAGLVGLATLTTRTHHQAAALGLLDADVEVVSFLPRKYANAVADAGVPFLDLLRGSTGIGDQRGRIARYVSAELDAPRQLSLLDGAVA